MKFASFVGTLAKRLQERIEARVSSHLLRGQPVF
jgi:hypothetical protein